MRNLLPIALLLLFSGCMKVGPNFRPPLTAVQEEWLDCDADLVTCETPDLSTWWTVFDDPILDELVGIAKGQNLPLQIACYRILEARAQLGIARGSWWPQLQQLFGSAQDWYLSDNLPNTQFFDTSFQLYQVGLQIAWELDFWGRYRRGIEAADGEFLASIDNFRDAQVILFADVASTYVIIRTLDERMEIVRRNITVQKRSLEIATARWEAGVVTELDVQQARTLLSQSKAQLPQLETSRRQAMDGLAVLLGMTPESIQEICCSEGRIPEAPPEIVTGIPQQLLCRRPDVRRAYHQAAAQSALIGVAMTDLLPRISLAGTIGFLSSSGTNTQKSGGPDFLFSGRSFQYVAGPSFTWAIFNYGRLKNQVVVERARFAQLMLAYENAVLVAYQEAEDGIISFIKAHEEVEYRRESAQAAYRATELSRTQYVEGIASYTRVLDTERSRLLEEDRLAVARGDVALGLIATYRALGGGWECD